MSRFQGRLDGIAAGCERCGPPIAILKSGGNWTMQTNPRQISSGCRSLRTAQAAPCRRTTRIAKIGPALPRSMFGVQAES